MPLAVIAVRRLEKLTSINKKVSQDVISINHTFSEKDMIHTGKDIERRMLTNAVQAHLDKRIILHDGRTIVFNR